MKKVIAKINGKKVIIITDCELRFFIITTENIYFCDHELNTDYFDIVWQKISSNKKYDLNYREKELADYVWEVDM